METGQGRRVRPPQWAMIIVVVSAVVLLGVRFVVGRDEGLRRAVEDIVS